jgi:hypothetical protein
VKTKEDCLYRAVKFEIHPNQDELAVLRAVSLSLSRVWNEALAERQSRFDEHLKPLYQSLKEAVTSGDKELESAIRARIKFTHKKHRITFFDQCKALTGWRGEDEELSRVPQKWQEETLKILNGAFTSFVSLRAKGDRDARPPAPRAEDNFSEIQGRYGFKLETLRGNLVVRLLLKKLAPELSFTFPIPDYQAGKLREAVRVRKFTLFRSSEKRGVERYWVSLAYEIPQPEIQECRPNKIVFVALGASSLGVVWPDGEKVVKLWRPDKMWKPKIDAVTERVRRAKPGSRASLRRREARKVMFRKTARQQTQNHREVVKGLLGLGVHFVVTDIVIRSKEGRLADKSKPERGGAPDGLNWSAQNTGSMANLVAWLKVKASEKGGSVKRFRLTFSGARPPVGRGHSNKLAMARQLKTEFLASLS